MSNLLAFDGKTPILGQNVFIADNARVIGDVVLGDQVNIWFSAVLRGDMGSIVVGPRSNIQDLAMVHMTRDLSHTTIGADVTIGHGAIVHGARVGDGCLLGMGSILLDNAEIGAECVVGAGALVTANTKVPARSLVLGSPARVVRPLSPEELLAGKSGALRYLALAEKYLANG